MKDLLLETLPHAPHQGLYVVPGIPEDKLRNALADYGKGLRAEEVLALYDATLMGSAKDGVLFAADRFIFQNNDLSTTHEVRYHEVVKVEAKRRLIGGQQVELTLNRGRTSLELSIDFSARPEAARHVARFLNEAMIHAPLESLEPLPDAPALRTDPEAVRAALTELLAKGLLTRRDFDQMLAVLNA